MKVQLLVINLEVFKNNFPFTNQMIRINYVKINEI